MSTFAERFIEEDMQQREAKALIKLLSLKLGELLQDTHDQIQAADTDTLLESLGSVLTTQSIDKVTRLQVISAIYSRSK